MDNKKGFTVIPRTESNPASQEQDLALREQDLLGNAFMDIASKLLQIRTSALSERTLSRSPIGWAVLQRLQDVRHNGY